MSGLHLAEINIARLLHPLDDPRIADFVASLDRINALAERTPGFCWRLKDETGNATELSAFDDPLVIVNMSVWTSPETLENFVWKTVHKQVYARRAEWFGLMRMEHFAMWWVEPGTRPTVAEGRERIEHLRRHGDSDHAFGWSHLPHVKLWQQARCA